MTAGALALLLPVVFAAFAVEASLGFGATVIAVALGSFAMPLGAFLPALVSVNLVLSATIVGRHRDGVDLRVLLGRIVPLMALGLPLGMLLFARADERLLRGLFGALVVVLSSLELLAMRRAPATATRPVAAAPAAALLLLGGVVHGAFATGGPMAVYVAGRLLDKRRFRSTLSALWLLLNAVLLARFVVAGSYDAASARLAALLLVPLVAGLVAGERLHGRIDARRFRLLVFSLLLVAGLVLAITA